LQEFTTLLYVLRLCAEKLSVIGVLGTFKRVVSTKLHASGGLRTVVCETS
jgi:hypothetical protein